MSKLYFGDNLDILRNFVADNSVDLIYLDPPFNSNVQYNVLFKTPEAEKPLHKQGHFGIHGRGIEKQRKPTQML